MIQMRKRIIRSIVDIFYVGGGGGVTCESILLVMILRGFIEALSGFWEDTAEGVWAVEILLIGGLGALLIFLLSGFYGH